MLAGVFGRNKRYRRNEKVRAPYVNERTNKGVRPQAVINALPEQLAWNNNVETHTVDVAGAQQLIHYCKTPFELLLAHQSVGPSKKLFRMDLYDPHNLVPMYRHRQGYVKRRASEVTLLKYQCRGQRLDPEDLENPAVSQRCDNKPVVGAEYCWLHLQLYFHLVLKQSMQAEKIPYSDAPLDPEDPETKQDPVYEPTHQLGVFADRWHPYQKDRPWVDDPVFWEGACVFVMIMPDTEDEEDIKNRHRGQLDWPNRNGQPVPIPHTMFKRPPERYDYIQNRSVVGMIQKSSSWNRANCFAHVFRLYRLNPACPPQFYPQGMNLKYPFFRMTQQLLNHTINLPHSTQNYMRVKGIFALRPIHDGEELILYNKDGFLPMETEAYKFETIQQKNDRNPNPRPYTHHLTNHVAEVPNYNRRLLIQKPYFK